MTKESYIKLPNISTSKLQDVIDYLDDNNIEYIEYYEFENELEEKNKQQERIEYLERSNNRREQQIIEQRDEIIELECIRDKVIELLEKGITFCENDSQGVYDKCNIAINREKKVLEILKGVIRNE